MSAPTLTTIRPGVTFTPAAAAAFQRAEEAWGRRIDVNSTHRDWDKQFRMWRDWNAYVAGRGPYPGHSRAIHPDLSMHCKGLALDSDDWTRPGFNKLMAEHGWIRTAAGDPTERHHFEYQSRKDQHQGEVAGDDPTLIEEELDMSEPRYVHKSEKGVEYMVIGEDVPGGWYASTDVKDGEAYGVLYGRPDGSPWITNMPYNRWVKAQKLAKRLNSEKIARQEKERAALAALIAAAVTGNPTDSPAAPTSFTFTGTATPA